MTCNDVKERLGREEMIRALYLGLVLRFADPEFTQAGRKVITALYEASPRKLRYCELSERTGYAIGTLRNILSGLRRKEKRYRWKYYPIDMQEGPTMVAVRQPEMLKFLDDLREDAERELKKSRE